MYKNLSLTEQFKYLAIGNSITLHGKCSYWFAECGMAASSPKTDYVHIVIEYLRRTFAEVSYDVFNYYLWEATEHDRIQTYQLLDMHLQCDINLITVQLSENVINLDMFERDFEDLLIKLRSEASKAIIIVIDDFWSKSKSEIKRAVTNRLNVPFVGLSDIANENYMCGIGTEVYGDDGLIYIVDHQGVAKHPNDEAMECIASRIIDICKVKLELDC